MKAMTTANDAWTEFGSKLSALGLKLKLHYEQEHERTDPDDQQTSAADGVTELIDSLGDTIKDAFGALGNAIDDEALRADAEDAGCLLIDAVDATFTEVANEVRERLGRS